MELIAQFSMSEIPLLGSPNWYRTISGWVDYSGSESYFLLKIFSDYNPSKVKARLLIRKYYPFNNSGSKATRIYLPGNTTFKFDLQIPNELFYFEIVRYYQYRVSMAIEPNLFLQLYGDRAV